MKVKKGLGISGKCMTWGLGILDQVLLFPSSVQKKLEALTKSPEFNLTFLYLGT